MVRQDGGGRLGRALTDEHAGAQPGADSRILIAAGALAAAAGFAWQSRITPDGDYLTAILGPAILISVGGGLLNTPLTVTVTSGVRADDAGAASGLMNSAKQVGGALGLAILVTLTDSHTPTPRALTADYGHAFAISAALLIPIAALAVALPTKRDTTGTNAYP